jgi:3-oxoacyl-[acyl-carrier-protein] synthase-3
MSRSPAPLGVVGALDPTAPGPRRARPRGIPTRAAVLDGLGVSLPPRVMHNRDFPASLATSDEWIRTRTGIVERRIAEPDVAASDLAVDAARDALAHASTTGSLAVIVATTTPDHPMPGVAPIVASRLGLATAAAFDVQAACAGFIYALASGAGLIAAGIADRALIIGTDVMSRVCDPSDRSTAVLFGDGAGAVTLRAGDPDELGAIGPFDLGSEGEFAAQLQIEAGGSRLPIASDTARRRFLTMDGSHVFRHAVRRMTESSRRALACGEMAIADVDRLIAHQANARILNAVADQLGVAPERRVSSVEHYGNTSAASIPMALACARPVAGERILLTAFGAGYTWGSALLTWPEISSDRLIDAT